MAVEFPAPSELSPSCCQTAPALFGGCMKVSKRVTLGAAAVLAAGIAFPVLAAPGHPQGGSGQTKCVDANGHNLDGDVTWSPTTIWPPNHKWQPITVNYADADGDGS